MNVFNILLRDGGDQCLQKTVIGGGAQSGMAKFLSVPNVYIQILVFDFFYSIKNFQYFTITVNFNLYLHS